MAQINPIGSLDYKKGKHSRKKCMRSTCHRAHVIITTRIDSTTGNEITERRYTPRTPKEEGGESLRYKSTEKTRDYTGKLLRLYKRRRDRFKRVTFKEINWARNGKRVSKRIGKHNKTDVKEYDENGKLVRHSVVNKREFLVKKDLNKGK